MKTYQDIESWVETELSVLARDHHVSQTFSVKAREALAGFGLMAPFVPMAWHGADQTYETVLRTHELIGSQCAAARTMLTVHGMVTRAVLRFGSQAQQDRLLPRLAAGQSVGCFAISEGRSGSDASDVMTTAENHGDSWRINGEKKWVSMAGEADTCLVFAREGEMISTFLVGLTPEMKSPVRDLSVVRGGMMAHLNFEDTAGERVGPKGGGFMFVLQDALTFGRLSVAAGALGAARACLETAANDMHRREGGAAALIDKQLIAGEIGEMTAKLYAADLALSDAARAYDQGTGDAATRACAAKYLASQVCAYNSVQALHLLGAKGLGDCGLVSRHAHDAHAWRLIEGSDEILKLVLADAFGEITRRPSWILESTTS